MVLVEDREVYMSSFGPFKVLLHVWRHPKRLYNTGFVMDSQKFFSGDGGAGGWFQVEFAWLATLTMS